MFSTCSELTPRAPIPDGRMERIMQPCLYQGTYCQGVRCKGVFCQEVDYQKTHCRETYCQRTHCQGDYSHRPTFPLPLTAEMCRKSCSPLQLVSCEPGPVPAHHIHHVGSCLHHFVEHFFHQIGLQLFHPVLLSSSLLHLAPAGERYYQVANGLTFTCFLPCLLTILRI